MKNVMLGMIGGWMVIYMTVILLSIFTIYSRQNELENCLSQIVLDTLDQYYVPEIFRTEGQEMADEKTIREDIEHALEQRIQSDTLYEVNIRACDMDKGILSVRVTERYQMPIGIERTWSYEKTAIIE